MLACCNPGIPCSKKAGENLSATGQQSTDARSILRQHNIGEGEYWVVCAGSRRGLEIKDWGEANWIAALGQIASETQVPFLFLGNEAEAAVD